MRVLGVFQVSVYTLLGLATLLLIVGEGAVMPQGIGFPLGALVLVFVDRWRVVRLPRGIINCGAVAALTAAGWEVLGEAPEARLTAAAHLLCYLSWLVLMGPKSIRHYWWLLTLAILQVAVGAALVDGPGEPLYAALLVVFMIASTWTLTVFSLYQVERQAADVAETLPAPVGHAWLRPSELKTGWQLDTNERWINSRFVLGVAGTSTAALVVASLFFLMIPRFWLLPRNAINDTENDPLRPLTGFTETVQLGEIGDILESTERVMSVQLVDRISGRARDLSEYVGHWGDGEPLFRGTVMSGYRNGRWERRLSGGRFEPLPIRPDRRSGFRQDIVLESSGTPVLFGIHPVEGCVIDAVNRYAMFHAAAGVLIGTKNRKRGRVLRYSLFSPPVDRAKPQPRVPSVMSAQQRQDYLALPRRGLNQLISRARQIAARPTEVGPAEKAGRLVRYLSNGDFHYSLDASVTDPSLDPVEDFLFRRRKGHCEYFASALTLMLRAVGVPSRLVSGFKGGTINRITGNLVVEQRHAHVWVEAWLDSKWTTLDPTPSARGEALQRLERNRSLWSDAGQAFSLSWRRYVVELSLNQQQEMFYLPLQRSVEFCVESLKNHADEGALAVQRMLAARSPGEGWPTVSAMFALLLGAGWIAWRARRWRWRKRSRKWRMVDHPGARRVVFFERFREIMAANGSVKAAAETAREFSANVANDWQDLLEKSGLDGLPARIVDDYYAVRFGGRPLEEWRVAEIDLELSRLDEAVHRTGAAADPSDAGQASDA